MPKVIKGALPGFVMEVVGVALLFTPLAPLGIPLIKAGAGLLIAGALGGALSTFTKKPSMNMEATQGRLHISVNPQAMGKWVFGETALPSDIVYAEQFGTKKDRILYIIAGASHKIESFGNFYVNDELISFSGDGATGTWANTLYKRTKTGAPGQTHIGNSFGGGTNVLPASFIGENTAYYGLVLVAGQTKTKDGLPTRFTHVVKGAPVYDPRLDTTVGGSGSHRANDQTTWEYSNSGVDIGANWALVVLFYLLGWRTAGGVLVFGVGVNTADIDYAAFMAAANVCATTVDSKPRYRVGGVFDTSQEHEQIISQLESAIGGKVGKFGGKYTIWAPSDDLTPFSSITEAELLRDVGVEFVPSGPIENLFNTSRGRYIEPAQLYQAIDYPEVVESTAVTEDGRSRVMSFDFAIVQDQSIAERVARQMVRRSRFTATWRFALGPKGLLFKPFDVTTLNIQETNNANETVRIISMEYGMNGAVVMEVLEEDSSIYNTAAALGTAVTQQDPAAYDPATVIAVASLAANDISITGSAGTASDALSVTWADPGGLVRQTQVQWKKSTDTDYIDVPPAQVDFLKAIIVPVEPGTLYDVRARHITLAGVPGPWSNAQETAGTTASALSVITKPNLIWDPQGRHGSLCWTLNAAWSFVINNDDGPHWSRGSWAGAATDVLDVPANYWVPVVPGETYILSVEASITGYVSGTLVADIITYQSDKSTQTGDLSGPSWAANTTGFQRASALVGTVPALSAWAKVRLFNQALDADTAKFRRVQLEKGAVASSFSADLEDWDALTLINGPAEAGANVTEIRLMTLYNPNFEAGDTGWDKADATIVSDASNAARGSWVARLAGAGTVYIINQNYIPVTPGDRLIAECYVKKTAGAGAVRIQINWTQGFGGSISYLSSEVGSQVSSSTYAQSRAIGVAPASATFAYITINLVSNDSASVIYADQFQVALMLKDADINALATTNAPVDAGADVTANRAAGLINPNYEAGDTGWAKGAGWTIVSDGQAADGSYGAKAAGAGIGGIQNNKYISVAVGDRVLATCLAKKTAGAGSIEPLIHWYTAAKGYISSVIGSGTTSATYVGIRALGTAPATAAFAQVGARVIDSDSSTVAYIDQYQASIIQTSDARSMNPLHVAGGISAFDVTPITGSTDAGSTATINIQASVLTLGGRTVSYPSGSVAGLSFGTKYYVYRDDPDLSGAGSYAATTSLATAVGDASRVYFGYITTVNDGGGGGGSPGGCVAVDQWLRDGQRAADARPGQEIACLGMLHDGVIKYPIESVEFSRQPCVELVSEQGINVIASVYTPMTLRDGSICNITEMLDCEVAVLDAGEFRWEPVVAVRPAGHHQVAHIHVGGRTYAGGAQPGRYIFTHNPNKP